MPRARLNHGRLGRAQESAELLLEPKHENIAPWFQIYWDSLPARDEFLWRRQPFPTDKLALLQDEALVGLRLRSVRPLARPSAHNEHGRRSVHMQSRVETLRQRRWQACPPTSRPAAGVCLVMHCAVISNTAGRVHMTNRGLYFSSLNKMRRGTLAAAP